MILITDPTGQFEQKSIGIFSRVNCLSSIRTSTDPRSHHLTATSRIFSGSPKTSTLRNRNRPTPRRRCCYLHHTAVGQWRFARTSSAVLRRRPLGRTALCCTSFAHLQQTLGASPLSSTHYSTRSSVQAMERPTLSQPSSMPWSMDTSNARRRRISRRTIL